LTRDCTVRGVLTFNPYHYTLSSQGKSAQSGFTLGGETGGETTVVAARLKSHMNEPSVLSSNAKYTSGINNEHF
jgi:hypothetical protein